MEECPLDLNKKADIVKLYWSSIFSRSQQFVIVGFAENTLVYTTISPVDVATYRPGMEDYIHVVTFKESKVYDIVVEKFLKNKVACYNVRECLAVLNKQKELFKLRLLTNSEIWPESEPLPADLTMCASEHPEDDDVEEEPVVEEVEADTDDDVLSAGKKPPTRKYYGWNLSEFTLEQYRNIINRYWSLLDFTEQEVPTAMQDKSAVYTIDLPYAGGIKVPMRHGYNIVSLLEYSVKSKMSYVLQARVAKDRLAVRVYFEFNDAIVNVKSVQPGAVWYPKF